jgi:hypothetical protein
MSCIRFGPGDSGTSADIFMLRVECRFNVISALRRPTYCAHPDRCEYCAVLPRLVVTPALANTILLPSGDVAILSGSSRDLRMPSVLLPSKAAPSRRCVSLLTARVTDRRPNNDMGLLVKCHAGESVQDDVTGEETVADF